MECRYIAPLNVRHAQLSYAGVDEEHHRAVVFHRRSWHAMVGDIFLEKALPQSPHGRCSGSAPLGFLPAPLSVSISAARTRV